MKKFIIIDGNALVHRAFHALPPLTTKDGTQVNAVYGFTSILLKVLKDIEPDYIALTFDVRKKTFRDELYADYKATRVKAPQELYDQIPLIKQVATAFHIPIFEAPGFEADDVIGTICCRKSVDNPEVESLIVTGDLDTLQLVDDNTKVFTMKKGINDTIIYDEAAVRERFGITPSQVVDYKGLRGDSSDNIPGVKGIGEKTALELIQKFGSLENIYQFLEHKYKEGDGQLKERIAQLLREQKDSAFLSKKLGTIVTDVPFDFRLSDCARTPYDREQVLALFSRLEFKSLMSRLPAFAQDADSPLTQGALFKLDNLKKNFRYELVWTPTEFAEFLKLLKKQKRFTLDTETTSLDPLTAELLGVSFAWQEGEAFYVCVTGEGKGYLDELRPIFEDAKILKSGHNMKFDYQILRGAGITLRGLHFDTMLASYLLNASGREHNLDALVFAELGHEMVSFDELVEKKRGVEVDMTCVPLDSLCQYSCEDADFTERLVGKFAPLLRGAGLTKVFEEIEMPLVPVLAEMELLGVKVDVALLRRLSRKISTQLERADAAIFACAGREFNIDSPLQLKQILFDTLHIPTQGLKKIKTGISTAADELEKLRGKHEIIDHIIQHRELAKLRSTYTDALPELVSPSTGRVHTSFNQAVAATGRLSSANPNLQNIPIRTELGAQIRQAFVAAEGFKIMSCDYSQIELRLVAHIANDSHLIEIFQRDEDVHAATAAKIYSVPIERVTKQMRSAAKTVNFGVLYGQGPRALAQQTGMTLDEAREFIKKYFTLFSGVHRYIEDTKALAHKLGYVETLWGRKRYLPDLYSGAQMVRAAAERMAVNAPIQGTQADLIKFAMIHIAEKLADLPGVKMVLQVHDELVFEVKDSLVKRASTMVRAEMEQAMKLRVPVKVGVSAGDNWGEMEKMM